MDNKGSWNPTQRAAKAASQGIWIVPEDDAERRRLSRGVKRGEFVSPMRGMYATAEEWLRLAKKPKVKALRTIRTLSHMHEGWVFCLFSAALVYGFEVSYADLEPFHVAIPRRSHIRSTSRISRDPTQTCQPVSHDGILVTPPVQTVVDCLLSCDFRRGLAIADSALRVLALTKNELLAELAKREAEGEGARAAGKGALVSSERAHASNETSFAAGSAAQTAATAMRAPDSAVRTARLAILHADPRPENGGESVARAVMIEQGFEVPELQVETDDPLVPGKVIRLDYLWQLESGPVGGELDGKDKYTDVDMTGGRSVEEVLRDERRRESHVGAKGLRVMRFSYGEATDERFFVRLLTLYGIPRAAALQT